MSLFLSLTVLPLICVAEIEYEIGIHGPSVARFQHGEFPVYSSPMTEFTSLLVAMEMSEHVRIGEDMDAFVQRMKDMNWEFELSKSITNIIGDDLGLLRAFYKLSITDNVELCILSNGGLSDEVLTYITDELPEEYYYNYPDQGGPIQDMSIKFAYIEIRVPIWTGKEMMNRSLIIPIDLIHRVR